MVEISPLRSNQKDWKTQILELNILLHTYYVKAKNQREKFMKINENYINVTKL